MRVVQKRVEGPQCGRLRKHKETPRAMTLFNALLILARTHTRDDERTGYVIEVGVGPNSYSNPASPEEYIEAWGVVREQLQMPTKPEHYKSPT